MEVYIKNVNTFTANLLSHNEIICNASFRLPIEDQSFFNSLTRKITGMISLITNSTMDYGLLYDLSTQFFLCYL